jgi:hypothetical protein
MIKRLFLTFLLIPFGVFAATHPDVGTASFSFLKVENGARPAAMGGAFTSLSDIYALWWNPAGIGQLDARTAITSYTDYFVDAQFGQVGYAQPVKQYGVAGGGISYISFGSAPRTDDQGNDMGTYSSSALCATAVFARNFSKTEQWSPYRAYAQNTSVGASIKYIYWNIDEYSAMAIAADIGLIHNVLYNKGLSIGLTLQNIGYQIKPFINATEPLPVVLRAGISYSPQYIPLLLSIDLIKPFDNYLYFAFGGEFKMMENVFLRAGYSLNRKDDWVIDSEQDKFMGAGVGFGLRWKKYIFDYAYTPAGQLGGINRFSFIGSF